MAKNKFSFWALVILVVTIISTVLFVTSVIVFAAGLPAIAETVRQAGKQEGASEATIATAIAIANATAISTFAVSSVLEVLTIVGGFLFSLKGRWGIFCIIMAILSAIGYVVQLFGAISSGNTTTIVTAILAAALSILLVIACIKHRGEIRR